MSELRALGYLQMESLADLDQYSLQSFGRAADAVFRFWYPHRDHRFAAHLFRTNLPDAAELIPDASFRPLALAVRLVYQQSEKAWFEKVVEILRPYIRGELTPHLSSIEEHWQRALGGRGNFTYSTSETSYSPREVLDTWLYAAVFHQDPKRQADLAALRSFEPTASFTLQVVVCQLAIATLNLDSVRRYLLDLPPRDMAVPPTVDESTGIL